MANQYTTGAKRPMPYTRPERERVIRDVMQRQGLTYRGARAWLAAHMPSMQWAVR